MNYVVLQGKEFSVEYLKAFEKHNLKTETDQKRFRDEVFNVQGAVEEALLKK